MNRPYLPDPSRDLILDGATLKALSHPLRNRLIKALRAHGPSTASQLAQRLGVNSGATSYHLRQLALAGLVIEEEDRGTHRDRWWRAAHARTYFDMTNIDEDASAAYLSSVAAAYADTMQRAVDELPALTDEWRQAGTLSDYPLALTAAESHQMLTELEEVIGRYRQREDLASAPDGARLVTVQLQVMPTPGLTEQPSAGQP